MGGLSLLYPHQNLMFDGYLMFIHVDAPYSYFAYILVYGYIILTILDTLDGCEILHQLIDGLSHYKPTIYSLHTYQQLPTVAGFQLHTGNLTQLWRMAIEIVSFHRNSMVIFQFAMLVITRGFRYGSVCQGGIPWYTHDMVIYLGK